MGPNRWGALRNDWSLCSNGTMQSPIDMSSRRVELVDHPKNLYRNYKPCNATMLNRGHDIMVKWMGDAGSIIINDTEYALKQAHWHSPSEHTINGIRFDMELHMVHLSIDNKIAVIAVLYRIGRPSHFLSKIQMSSRMYYRYMGSLTVPPCTEQVVWTLSRRNIMQDQYNHTIYETFFFMPRLERGNRNVITIHNPLKFNATQLLVSKLWQIQADTFDMELHMVHLSIDNKIAVIAVLYRIGRPSHFLSKLALNISAMIDRKGMREHSGIVNPREIQMSSRMYYRFMGSLTVPPCTEEVVWTLSR
ncbi:hypothetical protein M8C21_006973, partial [Ambrosia artemisiifolia]